MELDVEYSDPVNDEISIEGVNWWIITACKCVYMPAVNTGLHQQLQHRGEAQLFVRVGCSALALAMSS